MKKFLIVICFYISAAAQAQQNTLLDQAFWQGTPDINAVKAEVAKGNSPSQLNRMSMDAVVMAINAQAPTATIEYLVNQPGNDASKLTHDGRTYLHWAASRGNADLVAFLLDKGARMDLEDSHGTTPIQFAASNGQPNTKIYDLFIAHGADLKKVINQDGANLLLLAISNDKDLVLTNYFISKGLSLNSTDKSGNNAFTYAARSGNIELLKSLIAKGIKPGQNAMLMAAQGGGRRGGSGGATLALYQYLESLGVKATATNQNGENVLHALARRPGQEEAIKYFLAKGVDVNQADADGNTVFINAAATNRDTAVLALLLPHVKNINQANQQGATALTVASRSNTVDVMKYLLAKGSDININDKKGNNLAYYVIEAYRPQAAQGFGAARADDFEAKLALLKAQGLNIAAPQKDGNTLYHLAVAKNSVALLKKLEPMGIDVNAKNKDGITALHKAAMIARDDTVMKYLLSIGAKKDAVTNFKETAFDLASENESLTKNNTSLTFLK